MSCHKGANPNCVFRDGWQELHPHTLNQQVALYQSFWGFGPDQEVFEFRFRFLHIDTVWMQGAIPACSDSHQETECLVCFCADIMKNNPLLVLMGLLQHHCLECAVHKVFAIMAISLSLSLSFSLSLIIWIYSIKEVKMVVTIFKYSTLLYTLHVYGSGF